MSAAADTMGAISPHDAEKYKEKEFGFWLYV